MSDPIFVYDEAVVPVGARRNIILKHPSKSAILVDEIRFMYRYTTTLSLANIRYNPADALRVKIKVGNWAVTNGDVPVMLLCPLTNPSVYWIGQYGGGYGLASLTMKLAKPLYVPRNGQITFDFGLFNDLSFIVNMFGDMTVGVALAGRALASTELPQGSVAMPYATAWLSPVSTQNLTLGGGVFGAAVNYKTSVNDLKNGRKLPLKLTHMTACATIAGAGGANSPIFDAFGNGRDSNITAGSSFMLGVRTDIPNGGLRLQVRDTRGGFIVRDPTPLAMLIDPTSRSWQMNTILDPSNYLIASVAGGWAFAGGQTFRMGLGLLGYHEVPLADMGVSP